MTWDESEHPRDDEGKFTFKNGGEDDDEEKQKKGEKKKGEKIETNQDGFSDIKPFKLGAQYNDIRVETPAEVLYGKNSKTSKDNSIQKERNRLINKLGNKLTPAQVLYSSVDDLKGIETSTSQNKINNTIENDFKYNFKKHDELKQLLQSHHDTKNKMSLPENYELLEKYHSDKTGLDVEIYEHENELILSFPGSEQIKDYFQTDIKDIKIKNKNSQLDEAQDIFKKIKSNPQFENKKIIVTGYSLGGNIAAGLSVLNDVEGVTFNSYGDLDKILQQKANDLGQEIKINPEKLINYRHEKDGLSNYSHLGTNYLHTSNFIKLQSNIYSNHDIKSLNSSIQRYPDEIIHNKAK